MDVYKIAELKKQDDPKSAILEIELDSSNLSKFPMQVLYHKEEGYDNFMLSYDFNKCPGPVAKITARILPQMIKLIRAYEVNFYLKGFTKCVFFKELLPIHLKKEFSENILFYDSKTEYDEMGKLYSCEACMFNDSCEGISTNYLKKVLARELEPIIANSDMLEEHESEIEKMENEDLREISKKLLLDYSKEKDSLKKKILFEKDFSNIHKKDNDCIKYLVYNVDTDLNKIINNFSENFDSKLLSSLSEKISASDSILLSFSQEGEQINSSLSMRFNDLEREFFESEFGIQIEDENFDSIEVFNNSKKIITSFINPKIDKDLIKIFFKNIPLENKKKLFIFLNSCTKPLQEVSFSYVYDDSKVIAKRVKISMEHNQFKLNHLSILFNLRFDALKDKKLHSLEFELTEDSLEEINFYYSLKKTIEEPEEIGEIERDQ